MDMESYVVLVLLAVIVVLIVLMCLFWRDVKVEKVFSKTLKITITALAPGGLSPAKLKRTRDRIIGDLNEYLNKVVREGDFGSYSVDPGILTGDVVEVVRDAANKISPINLKKQFNPAIQINITLGEYRY